MPAMHFSHTEADLRIKPHKEVTKHVEVRRGKPSTDDSDPIAKHSGNLPSGVGKLVV